MNSWERRSFVITFYMVQMAFRPALWIVRRRFCRLVCLGICSIILQLNLLAWVRISVSLGVIMSSKLWVAYYWVSTPPHGGHMMSASVWKGYTFKKSWFKHVILLGFLPYILRLCLSMSILSLSISLTIYSSKLSERWTAIPPTPQKGSKILLTFLFLLKRLSKYSETD